MIIIIIIVTSFICVSVLENAEPGYAWISTFNMTVDTAYGNYVSINKFIPSCNNSQNIQFLFTNTYTYVHTSLTSTPTTHNTHKGLCNLHYCWTLNPNAVGRETSFGVTPNGGQCAPDDPMFGECK